MAITLVTTPDTYSFAGNAMVYTATSNRDNAVSTTVTLADYSGTVAGTVKGTTPSAHGLVSGDIVQITNTSMNGTYAVTVIDADEFYFTKTYSATDNAGNVTRLNSNFQIRCDVKNAAGTTTWASIRKSAVSGTFTWDISEVISAQLSPAPQAIGGAASLVDSGGYVVYTCVFTEEFDDQNGLLKGGSDASDTPRAAIWGATQYDEDQDTDDYISENGNTGNFLTNATTLYLKRGDSFHLSLLTTSNVTGAYLHATLTSTAGSETTDQTTEVNVASAGVQLVVFPINAELYASNTASMVVVAKDQDDNTISESVTVYIDDLCDEGQVIWWLNPLGGWDCYRFRTKPDKVIASDRRTFAVNNATKRNYTRKVLNVDSWEEYTITSEYLRPTQGDWVAEILRSPDVRVQDGSTLRPIVVLDDSYMTDGEELTRIVLNYQMAEGLK